MLPEELLKAFFLDGDVLQPAGVVGADNGNPLDLVEL